MSLVRFIGAFFLLLLSSLCFAAERPNILVIWGDDVGWSNIGAYNDGMMGYPTTNLDRIANEGIRFTDAYGDQSCTAGRSSFILGQHPIRTGLTRVGIPGAKVGIQKEDVTLASLLRDKGYVTGQFGKNHLGDRDEHLPTNHGFDEFFGNLYHLDAEEAPEHPDYPKDPMYHKLFGPRGVIKSSADGKVEDSGPLTIKRMETIDQEFAGAALAFIDKAHAAKKPFFVWFNSSRMHTITHLSPKWEGKTGQGVYADGMQEHDHHVGQLLDRLDELGLTENTIVFYSTDNGAQIESWPDGGMSPFRGSKNTSWEGGFRVPAMVRWPGKIKPGVSNAIISHLDWLPTLMAAVGEPNLKDALKKGKMVNGRRYKNHLDGYNFLPYLTGQTREGPRKEFIYATDLGDISAIRVGQWKAMFTQQHSKGFNVWSDPNTEYRIPKLYNLRRDPYERAETDSDDYIIWYRHTLMAMYGTIFMEIDKFLKTFEEFPQRQSPTRLDVKQLVDDAVKGKQGKAPMPD